ncbi:MAG: hypothetical protein GX638_02350 [Crenarchaeota archaeon]|nr:hypothetical protein [Thermoproteota archaeon]
MERIIGYCGTGKTKKLMTVAKDTDAFFVCKNPTAMIQKAYAYNLRGIKFISYNDFLSSPKDYNKVVVDDLDALVTIGLQGHMVGFSLCNCD